MKKLILAAMIVIGTMAFGNGVATTGEAGYSEYKYTQSYSNVSTDKNQELATKMSRENIIINENDVTTDEGHEYTRNYDVLDVDGQDVGSPNVTGQPGYEEYKNIKNIQ